MSPFLKAGNTWAVFKTLGNTPLIKERFIRSVGGSLRALFKILNNFVGILWGSIALLFLSSFISCCISSFINWFMDKVFLVGFLNNFEKYV